MLTSPALGIADIQGTVDGVITVDRVSRRTYTGLGVTTLQTITGITIITDHRYSFDALPCSRITYFQPITGVQIVAFWTIDQLYNIRFRIERLPIGRYIVGILTIRIRRIGILSSAISRVCLDATA